MNPVESNHPAITTLVPFPSLVTVLVVVVLTAVLLAVAGKFDATGGVLTISIMITLGMLGVTTYCLIFAIPPDDITPGVVGGLTAGFGAVVAHWLGRASNGRKE